MSSSGVRVPAATSDYELQRFALVVKYALAFVALIAYQTFLLIFSAIDYFFRFFEDDVGLSRSDAAAEKLVIKVMMLAAAPMAKPQHTALCSVRLQKRCSLNRFCT